MKKSYIFVLILFLTAISAKAQNPLNCDFSVAVKACINQHVKVLYTGGVSANATYTWNFDGAVIISGSGQGPYYVKWETVGEKHIVLTIHFESQFCTATKPVVVIEQPGLFHMTGGGVVIPGSPGVSVGLSGSQTGIIYKLRRNGQNTGVVVQGSGQAISFGLQTVPGSYSAIAAVDGSECIREMEGDAIVTASLPPPQQVICMVTFDTATSKNKIIWNKHPGYHLSHYNIFRETYQNNVFVKIGEVPFSNLSVFTDPSSDPLIKSDKFKISVTDSAGYESEKSPFHKTIHLNINAGIYGFNLIWNHYEGFEFLTYRIHRKYNSGSWETIDSVAGNVNSYTDFYTTPGITTYYIEVLRPEPCNPSMKSNGILSVISNTAAAAPLGIGEDARTGILVYPNPASEKLNLVVPVNSVFRVELFRLDGVTLFNSSVTGPGTEIDVSEFSKGLYILKITGDNTVITRKIVKN
ncbi:MAG: T9SS type A sorting domain-containing protein [Bacteroidales bacterium]|nr:T9SS type A sorting domain-containing protein [Bacteroidales bacterium]